MHKTFNIQYTFHSFLAGLKVIKHDELQRWPCQSSHCLIISLDGVKLLAAVTLPNPLLSDTVKATLDQKDGVAEVVAAKALNDLWPKDVIRAQFQWNADALLRGRMRHLGSQFFI